jgi:diguanylate cyclase (GGDEF)-like protein
MRPHHIHRVFLLALLLVAPAMGAGSDYATLLREADRVRSSDPVRFGELVGILESRSDEASEAQRQQLQYLTAYRMILHGNAMDAGIAKAERLFEEAADSDLKFRAGSLVVNVLGVNRRFTEGLRYLTQTLAMRNAVKDKDIRHDGINVAAVLYNQLGQYKLGLEYAEETLADSPNPRAKCFAGFLRVEAQYYLSGSSDDDANIKSVIDYCIMLRESVPANFARVILARHFARNGDRSKAIRLLRAHMSEVDALGYARLITEFRSLLAELSLENGDMGAAEQHAQAAVAQESDLSSSQALAIAYRTLHQIAQTRGDLPTALLYYKQYAEADKAWLNEAKARELAFQIVRHENLQQTQQIALLNQQNELLQLQQRVQQQEARTARLVMVMLVLLLATLGLWTYKTKRMQLSLRRMAETDALTGICNRHHFNLRAEQLLGQCERAGEDVALVMFDLDHFKSINDRYGHASGDWVLRKVAEACVPLCREVDVFGRLGGEEFAVLLAGHDLRSARRLADDLRMRLAGIDTSDSGDVFRVTASFGVATSQLTGADLDRLMSTADRMLYRAKRAGRNRVCVYEGQVSPTHAIPVRPLEDDLLATDAAPPATETDTGQGTWMSAGKSRNVATS